MPTACVHLYPVVGMISTVCLKLEETLVLFHIEKLAETPRGFYLALATASNTDAFGTENMLTCTGPLIPTLTGRPTGSLKCCYAKQSGGGRW